MPDAVGSHDIELAIVESGAAAYTVVAGITSDLGVKKVRATTKYLVHKDRSYRHHPDPAIDVQAISFSGNYHFDDGTHDEVTGMQKLFDDNEKFGMQFRGPAFVAETTEDITYSGWLLEFEDLGAVGPGIHMFNAVFQPSGVFQRNGDDVGGPNG